MDSSKGSQVDSSQEWHPRGENCRAILVGQNELDYESDR